MKDFYEQEQESFAHIERPPFIFAGVEFRVKPIMPADVHADLVMLNSDKFDENAYDFAVSMIRRTLQPQYRAKWDDVLVQEREVPITLKMLFELIGALSEDDASLIAAATGRPTQPLSPSTPTGESTTTPSTGNSGSTAEKDSTPSPSVPA